VPFAEEHEHRPAAHVTTNSLSHNAGQAVEAPAQVNGLKPDEDLNTVGNRWAPILDFRARASSSTIASVPRSNPAGTSSRSPPNSTAIAPVGIRGLSPDSGCASSTRTGVWVARVGSFLRLGTPVFVWSFVASALRSPLAMGASAVLVRQVVPSSAATIHNLAPSWHRRYVRGSDCRGGRSTKAPGPIRAVSWFRVRLRVQPRGLAEVAFVARHRARASTQRSCAKSEPGSDFAPICRAEASKLDHLPGGGAT